MKRITLILFFALVVKFLHSQPVLDGVTVSPNPFKSRTLVTYTFSGSGTDTINIYVTTSGYLVMQTLRSNFVVSAGVYQDSIRLDDYPIRPYNVTFAHGTEIFKMYPLLRDITVSVSEESDESCIFQVFPNPFQNVLKFEMPNANGSFTSINIYNSEGMLVYSKQNQSASAEIDLNFLKSGLYYAEIKNYKYQRFIKVVKQ